MRCKPDKAVLKLLTMIDVSANKSLATLRCDYNDLTELDLSENSGLTFLTCDGNQLTSLILPNNSPLNYVSCDYNLFVTLDLTNITQSIDLSIRFMPTLKKVCVNEMPFRLDTDGSSNAFLTTDCNNS
jgi:hypothetical protein